MLSDPFNSFLQPLVWRNLGLPARQLGSLVVIAYETHDFALCGSDADIIQFDPHRSPNDVPHLLDYLTDCHIHTASNVDDLPDASGRSRDPDETVNCIADESKVAPWLQRTQFDHIAGQRLRDDRRNDGSGRLTRTVGIEWPDRGDGHSKRPMVASTSLSAPILLAE